MNICRSIVAVILGYAVFAASAVLLFRIAGRDAHVSQNLGFVLFAVAYGAVFAGLGGLLTARIAPKNGTLHAAFVTLIIAAGATISLVSRPGAGSTWSQWAAIVVMAPTAWGAATVFARRSPR